MKRRHLVIVRAGDSSLHPEWLRGDEERSWDLVVNYFGDDPKRFREDDIRRIDSKGPKWPALHALIEANPDFVSDYDYVWLPDDDLSITKGGVNRLFSICEQYKLEAAQPALTWNSYYSFMLTLRNGFTLLRYTNFAEIMAPCLSSDLLKRALPLFGETLSGWGLDYVWSRLAKDPANGVAIIDAVTVRHTRPVGGPNYKHLIASKVSPSDERDSFCVRHGLDKQRRMHKVVLRNGMTVDLVERPSLTRLIFTIGLLPAAFFAQDHLNMMRRLSGLAWRGVFQRAEIM